MLFVAVMSAVSGLQGEIPGFGTSRYPWTSLGGTFLFISVDIYNMDGKIKICDNATFWGHEQQGYDQNFPLKSNLCCFSHRCFGWCFNCDSFGFVQHSAIWDG